MDKSDAFALPLGCEQRFAQRVIGTLFGAGALVEIKPEPRLDHGVDVEGSDLAAHGHEIDRTGVDREVDAEALAAAFRQQRNEDVTIVVAGDGLPDEFDAVFFCQRVIRMRIDDDKARYIELEMLLDQRKGAFSDRTESDHDDRPGDACVHG